MPKIKPMKKIILLSLLTLAVNAFAQNIKNGQRMSSYKMVTIQPAPFIVDSGYHYTWDQKKNAWTNAGIFRNIYNKQDSLTKSLYQTWDTSAKAFINDNLIMYTLDAKNERTAVLYQSWGAISKNWEDQAMITYYYDGLGNKTGIFVKSWNSKTKIWDNNSQTQMTYENKNLKTTAMQYWNTTSSSWDSSTKQTYTYDSRNNNITYQGQNWFNGNWVNYFLTKKTYDANNNIKNIGTQSWSVMNGQLEYFDTLGYSYNGSNMKVGLWIKSLDMNTKIWIDYLNETDTYDSNNNLKNLLTQRFNTHDWNNYYQESYSYDNKNFKKSKVFTEWSGFDSRIIEHDSTVYFTHATVTGTINLEANLKGTAYPNPSTGKLYLFNVNLPGKVEVYNLSGVQVYSSLQNEAMVSNEIDLTELNKGLYFVKIYKGSNVSYQKIVLE
jgi:hypothetical protein